MTVHSSAAQGSGDRQPDARPEATNHQRSGALAIILAAVAVAVAVAGCGSPRDPARGTNPPTVASHGNNSAAGSSDTTTTLPAANNPTALVDEWAACERRHGDINQAEPVIDSHGVINITLPPLSRPEGGGGAPQPPHGNVVIGDPHGGSGTCSQYLTRAQVEVRAEYPVQDPLGVTNTATIIAFASCMRANGVPNYPYPSGPNDSQTNFLGTGVDPNSPHVTRVNDYCGKKLHLPEWWINGWGPPGDISVNSAGVPTNPGACAYTKEGCGAKGNHFSGSHD